MAKHDLFIFVGNGPYLNHGCEAIEKSTIKIINSFYHKSEFVSASFYPSRWIFYKQKKVKKNLPIRYVRLLFPSKRNPDDWLKYKIFSTFYKDKVKYLRCAVLSNFIQDAKAVLALGGDNYTLDYGTLDWHVDINNYVIEHKKPLILWGASVGPFDQDLYWENYMKEHLKKVTAIFARESLTIEYLDKLGVRGNVYKVCDPAFLLEKESINDLKIDQNSIGLNISR